MKTDGDHHSHIRSSAGIVPESAADAFGHSVITQDARPGSPLRVVYHGTHEVFSEFRLSERGSLGQGIYFCSTLDEAFMYGGEDPDAQIMQVHLCLQRPYFYKVREPQEIDVWGEDLILDIFTRDESASLLEKALRGDALFGDEIPNRLRDLGHDGIVATYANGSQELVAFEPSQIRLAAPTHSAAELYALKSESQNRPQP